MKYQSSNTKTIYNIDFNQKMSICPECSGNRKKKNVKNLQYYSETKTAYCFHCLTTYFEYKPYEAKQYIKIEWKNKTELSDKLVKFFEGRGLMQETLIEMKIYSDKEFMPQFNKETEVICFPYFLDSDLKNIKFRGAKKSFKLVSGAELIFYNINCLKEFDEIIITEGEIDTLSFIQNGFKNCLSVPNGANTNMEYLDNYIEMFDSIDKIYLACDNDTKGIELRDEFIRRLGAEKCNIVSFKECKDANEYLTKYGGLEFKDLIKNSRQAPVKGTIFANSFQSDLLDYYNNGIKEGLKIKNNLDEFMTWETSRLAIVTGEPGSGKSDIVDYIVVRLNLLYNWKAAFFTPENYPLKYHYSKLYEKLIGKQFSKEKSNDVEYDIAYEYINDNYFWILDEEDMTIEKILANAKYFIKTKGIKILVIDPYNVVEHKYSNGETEAKYVSRFLETLRSFEKFNDILIFLVAHPRTIYDGKIPTLYSISGGANFYNKADYGIITDRRKDDNNIMTNDVDIYIKKVKFKHLGSQGIAEFKYNYNNGRLEDKNNDVTNWDNSNWLVSDIKTISDTTEPEETMPF